METTIITGRVTAPRPTGGLVGRARVVSACVAAAFAVIFGHALLTSSRSAVSTAQQSARTWARVPAGAREAISRDLGAREARFLVTRTRSGLVARSSGLQATFGRRGVVVRGGAGASLRLGLEAVGRGRSLTPMTPVSPTAKANTVSFVRAGIEEWYANGPLGLEQGFTVSDRMPGTGRLSLWVGRVPAVPGPR